MDVSKYKDGRVHFRNSGMKGLNNYNPDKGSTQKIIFFLLFLHDNIPYLSYVFGQTDTKLGVSSGSTLFAIHPAINRHNIR